MCRLDDFTANYRYLGPEWLQSSKNQIDLGEEIASAPAQPCVPAKKPQKHLSLQVRGKIF